jgi:N-acetylmuramoyl-L-alanine amidase
MRVAISMGHAFSDKAGRGYQLDPGYVNEEYRIPESDVVGLCGRLLMDILKYPVGIEATRIPRCSLEERIEIINAMHQINPFDLAVEIHLNAFRDHRVRGTEVWYNPNQPGGKEAAGNFAYQISRTLRSRNRGAKSSTRLAFVRNVVPTSVLTESEFLSNSTIAGAVKDFLIPKIAWGHALTIWGLNRKGA